MRYIAYGSNMNQAQMEHRCPDARFLGIGFITNARFDFKGQQIMNAHATLTKITNPRVLKDLPRIPVAIWNISTKDEAALDRFEGVPYTYRKERWPVVMQDGSKTDGLIYIMNHGFTDIPTEEYYRRIRTGYYELGLNAMVKPVLEAALERAFRYYDEYADAL